MANRGEYRAIYAVLLDSPEFIALSPEAQLVFFHLKLRLGASGIAVIYLPVLEQAIPQECLTKGLTELRQGREKAWLFVDGNVFWLRNGLRYNASLSMAHERHRKGIQAHLSSLPKLRIANSFARYYGLEEPFPDLEKPESIPKAQVSLTNGTLNREREKGEGEGRRERDNNSGVVAELVREEGRLPVDLSNFLAEYPSALSTLASTGTDFGSSPDCIFNSIIGKFIGPGDSKPMDPFAYRNRPESAWPWILATAIVDYWSNEEKWRAAHFRGFVLNAASKWTPPGEAEGKELASEGRARASELSRQYIEQQDREIEEQGVEVKRLEASYMALDSPGKVEVEQAVNEKLQEMGLRDPSENLVQSVRMNVVREMEVGPLISEKVGPPPATIPGMEEGAGEE